MTESTAGPGVRLRNWLMTGVSYMIPFVAAYLVVIAVSASPTRARKVAAPAALGFRGGFAQGLTTNLLNAKAALFLIGSLAAFHPPGSPPWLKWALGAIVLAQAATGWSAFVCLLGWAPVRTWFLRRQRPWNAVFGVLLVVAGAAAIGSW